MGRREATRKFQACKKCGVKLEDHDKADHEYMLNEHKIIICSIKSAGVGITLTASSRMCFVELPWHSADSTQCEDRFHRNGQKDSVQCVYFLGKDTIDEWIYQVIEDKREMSNSVMGIEDDITSEIIDKLYTNIFSLQKNKE